MIEPLESRIAPASIVTITDASGDAVTVEVEGAGNAVVTLVGGALNNADIDLIDLFGTDLTSKLTVKTGGLGQTTTVNRIQTNAALQNLGTIDLFNGVTIGSGVADAITDVKVTGKLNELLIVQVAANTIFRLGEGLPYDVPNDTKTPDTYNNRPLVELISILGPGVELNVIGDGVTPQGVGGGGLGKVTIGSWDFPGFIRTTQSIESIDVLFGNFFPTLEVDKFNLGAGTIANVGAIKVSNGTFGSSQSEVEGAVKSFDANQFLANASLTAASLGKVSIGGNFDGTLTLTDPDSPALPSFTVDSDFTGTVISAGSIKKLKILGNFKGSLQAPLIGSISADAFLGTVDGFGVPTTFIRATTGGLGTISTKAGPIKDFEIQTSLAFKGLKVSLSKLTDDTIGLNNVHITAASIGNISVSLKAVASATGIDLVGIQDSTFVTTGIGATKSTAGNIGKVSVSIGGAAGGTSATGIVDSTFDALVGDISVFTSTVNKLGDISVKIGGQSGATVGLQNVSFAANNLGKTFVKVSHGTGGGSTAHALGNVDLTATDAIAGIEIGGDATLTQVDGLEVWAGGNIGSVKVTSKDGVNGTLANSAVVAGQRVVIDNTTTVKQLANLGAVTVSGSLTNTKLVSYGSIGAVSVGVDLTNSLILAGAKLGDDFLLDGDESFQRTASVAALKVGGAFTQTSVVAGVNPVDNIFGNVGDIVADLLGLFTAPSFIGKMSLAAGSTGAATGTHVHAIEAGVIAGLKLGGSDVTGFPLYLDGGTIGTEDATDILVKIV